MAEITLVDSQGPRNVLHVQIGIRKVDFNVARGPTDQWVAVGLANDLGQIAVRDRIVIGRESGIDAVCHKCVTFLRHKVSHHGIKDDDEIFESDLLDVLRTDKLGGGDAPPSMNQRDRSTRPAQFTAMQMSLLVRMQSFNLKPPYALAVAAAKLICANRMGRLG